MINSVKFLLVILAGCHGIAFAQGVSTPSTNNNAVMERKQSPEKKNAAQRQSAPPNEAKNRASDTPNVTMDCAPSSVNCPVIESSGSSIISTDSLPIGSAIGRDGKTITESQYPTSPGAGAAGSGITGTPTGPSREPAIGIGR